MLLLNLLVLSVRYAGLAFAAGLAAVFVLWLLSKLSRLPVTPLQRWTLGAVTCAVCGGWLVVVNGPAYGELAQWGAWLGAICVTLVTLLMLVIGLLVAGVRSLWRVGKSAIAGDAAAGTDPSPGRSAPRQPDKQP
jgi:hypothetical protein